MIYIIYKRLRHRYLTETYRGSWPGPLRNDHTTTPSQVTDHDDADDDNDDDREKNLKLIESVIPSSLQSEGGIQTIFRLKHASVHTAFIDPIWRFNYKMKQIKNITLNHWVCI